MEILKLSPMISQLEQDSSPSISLLIGINYYLINMMYY